MAEMQHEATPAARGQSMFGRITRCAMGAVIGALAGLAAVVIMGMVAWGAVRGFSGAIIAAIVGALLGGVLRGFGDWPARALGGGVGGAVGGFFAVAAAEQSPPGSAEWAFQGGLLGAVFGVPIAAVAGVAVGIILALNRPRA
jgi:hypothetical protein